MIARIIPSPGVPPDKNPTVLSLRVKYPRLKVVNAPGCKAPPFILEEDLIKPYRPLDDPPKDHPGVYIIDW